MDIYEFYSESDKKVDKKSNKTFNTKDVLAALYLWLLFGYLSTMVGCDLQRYIVDSLVFRHFIGLISFFLLFTLIDSSNNTSVPNILIKTMYTYASFLFLIKVKAYFSIPILVLLVLDQAVKSQCAYLEKNSPDKVSDVSCDTLRDKISMLIIALVSIGFIHYFVRQYIEFGNNFSIVELLFGYKCKF